ncbi:hypothetical protein LJPFL01_3916 [Lelliottia jeotgali]|nr:hypothetical protein LJPFL01_3916 [Lelliottia jeotgali]
MSLCGWLSASMESNLSILKRIPVTADNSKGNPGGISANSWSYFNLLTFALK